MKRRQDVTNALLQAVLLHQHIILRAIKQRSNSTMIKR